MLLYGSRENVGVYSLFVSWEINKISRGLVFNVKSDNTEHMALMLHSLIYGVLFGCLILWVQSVGFGCVVLDVECEVVGFVGGVVGCSWFKAVLKTSWICE